jgi:hypothetical protein
MKSVIIVIQHPGEENIKLPEKLHSDNMSDDDNCHWELRYLVTTQTGSVPNNGRADVLFIMAVSSSLNGGSTIEAWENQ